ncbi:hypothetical protein DFH06DRAFT_1247653, partial [Mycena polygramma]
MDSMWWFELGRQNSVDVPPWDASPSDVAAVLPYVTLPALVHLTIYEPIDPAALGEFFRRHPLISVIHDHANGASMFLDAPVTLQRLTEISCVDIRRLAPLLDAFDRSPQLTRISIPFQCDTRSAAATLTDALRRLRTSSLSLPICLVLDVVESEFFEALPLDVARRLHGVDWVIVRCDTLIAASALVPWIALFPALQRVEFEIGEAPSGPSHSPAASAFYRETRDALTRVPIVSFL